MQNFLDVSQLNRDLRRARRRLFWLRVASSFILTSVCVCIGAALGDTITERRLTAAAAITLGIGIVFLYTLVAHR